MNAGSNTRHDPVVPERGRALQTSNPSDQQLPFRLGFNNNVDEQSAELQWRAHIPALSSAWNVIIQPGEAALSAAGFLGKYSQLCSHAVRVVSLKKQAASRQKFIKGGAASMRP